MKKAQKALSWKTNGSNNRNKARLQVARIHALIKDARTDFLHKLTTKLVQENDLIVVEDLAVRNMVKNRKLTRSISDASWGEFFRQLEYKCQWYEKELIKIDRYFPSSKRCGNCGMIHDRDINASRNILAAGLAVSASVAHGGNPQDRADLSVERP
ncbi:transposase, IS200/IS605 family protein [Aphanothece sacrum FPU1]|uniref:Transposase, IS200/IS605 family protein n=1 Tax=Aphanothece sacrum FPU1 TaxID=1920663 RepID=A0A401IBL4_APHSA|nr:transposase, IS200/IS605 family protein [Aphanothece sacrum FPU1]GBF84869.1 transposase, IS200/IS605 family [Aphanothece sacrum FPU3]